MQSVADFYAGQTLFITGATGFIGKVLVEKLLRCCPKIKELYLLVRPKKGQDVQQRIDDLVKSLVFERLRKDQPNFGDKIIPISGEMVEDGLGISLEDQEKLRNNVTLVFHSAATIRFDEPMKDAVKMNVQGVQSLVRLSKTFKKLEAFIHVSTAYANCDRDFIEEVCYPPPVDAQKLIEAAEWMGADMLDAITPQLIGKKPNTYTYTKQVAESVLMAEGQGLNMAISRPSIVGASWKEPVPGWIDNINGPGGLYIAAGKGMLKSITGNRAAVADIIPVDLFVNILINIGWYTAVVKPKDTLIYNCTTGSINPLNWGEMEGIVMNYWKTKNPLENCFRRPKGVTITSGKLHDCWVFLGHMIPAYLTDLAFRCVGKKPRMVKIYGKMHKAMGMLMYFMNNSWRWTYHNSEMLKSQMSEEDLKMFYMCPRSLHWPTYLENYCGGMKQFVLNEGPSGLPAARAHLTKLRNIRYTFNTVILIALWRILIARSQIARNLWYLIMGLVFKFVRNLRLTSTIRK